MVHFRDICLLLMLITVIVSKPLSKDIRKEFQAVLKQGEKEMKRIKNTLCIMDDFCNPDDDKIVKKHNRLRALLRLRRLQTREPQEPNKS